MKIGERFRDWFKGRAALWWAVVIGAVLTLPALGTGLVIDDLAHRAMLADDAPEYLARGPLDLYRFMPDSDDWRREAIDAGTHPWYADSALHIELWRNGEMREIAVRAEEIPDAVVRALVTEALGMELELREKGGCLVRSVRSGGGAQRIGIQSGDLVLGISNVALQDAEALRRAALALRGRSHAQIVVQRGAGRYHVTIPLF